MEETWMYVLSASFVLLLLLPKLLLSLKKTKHKNLPPSPPKLPVLGHLHLIKEPIHRCFQHLAENYGHIFLLSFGSHPVLVITSPSLVEECFTKNDIVLANRSRHLAGKHLHYNYTTLGAANYGDHWRNLRRLTALEILSTNRLNMFLGIRQEEVRMLVKNLFKISSHGPVNAEMKSRITELAFNVVMRMISGKRYFGTEVENLEEALRFRDLIKEIFALSGSSNLGDYLSFLRWVDYQGFQKKLVMARKQMDEFLQNLIEEHRNKRNSCQEDKRNKTMIDAILTLQESDPEYYSDEIIQGLIVILLTAGTDTSSVTIEWAMSLLLNHPNVLKKARAELDKLVGQERLVDEPDISELPYLQCIINETLRLFPAAPLLVPHESSDDCIIGGYDIPRGTILFVNAWAIQRDPKVWEDPDSFRPERFEGLNNDAYRLIPFGLGRRSCPGAGLANRVVGLALAAMIQCFEWERIGEEQIDMTEGTGLTMPKVEPLEAICKPRDSMTNVLSKL